MLEGDISELSSETIRALHETVENELKTKNYRIVMSSASKAGTNNFMGTVYRATFCKQGEVDKEKNPELKMIVKVAPTSVARREQFTARPSFLQEMYMYGTVLPYFREFEKSKGLTDQEGFIEYPKMYRAVDTEFHESIFLEDLNVRNFSIIDRFTQETNADHTRLMMECLGKFHALSLSLKDQQPQKFKELASNLDELYFRPHDRVSREFYNSSPETMYNVVSGKEDTALLSKLKKVFEKEAADVAADCNNVDLDTPASIIRHGDAWQNNCLYRYDEHGKAIEMNLLDWQIAHLATTPISDVIHFIFPSTTKELRDAHYDEFLEAYYNSLSSHMRKLGSDPNKIFSHDLMMEHFRKYGKLALIYAVTMLPVVTAEKGKELNLDDIASQCADGGGFSMDAIMSEESKIRFHKRLRDVIVDMARLGYI